MFASDIIAAFKRHEYNMSGLFNSSVISSELEFFFHTWMISIYFCHIVLTFQSIQVVECKSLKKIIIDATVLSLECEILKKTLLHTLFHVILSLLLFGVTFVKSHMEAVYKVISCFILNYSKIEFEKGGTLLQPISHRVGTP